MNVKLFKNKDKPKKIHSATPQKVGKIVLWVLVIFLIFRGIGSVIRGDTSQTIEKKVDTSIETVQIKNEVKNEAAAYATGFVKEYLTYKEGATEEYRLRLAKYMPEYLISQVSNIQTSSDVQATDVTVISSKYYTDHQLNVDVRARTKYVRKTNQDSGKEVKEEIKEIYLRVPVVEQNRKYVIEDLPIVIPKPENANVDFSSFNGNSVEASTKTAIESMISSFLKTYYEGKDNELNYYMYDAKKEVHSINGGFKLKAINETSVYQGKNKDENIVIVSFAIEDTNSNQEIKQKINISTVKKDDRYYIIDFDVRTGNLK